MQITYVVAKLIFLDAPLNQKFFFKIVQGKKFVLECVSNDIFSPKNVFYILIVKFFLQKSEIFEIAKIKKCWKKE